MDRNGEGLLFDVVDEDGEVELDFALESLDDDVALDEPCGFLLFADPAVEDELEGEEAEGEELRGTHLLEFLADDQGPELLLDDSGLVVEEELFLLLLPLLCVDGLEHLEEVLEVEEDEPVEGVLLVLSLPGVFFLRYSHTWDTSTYSLYSTVFFM